MRGWFLSYNSQDLQLMESLEKALRKKDTTAEIFFAPKTLRPGGYWLPELAEGIEKSTAFVLLVGEHKLGPWQVVEYYEALDKRVKASNFPIILVLLNDQAAPGLPFLRQLHWIITADVTSEQTLAQLLKASAGSRRLPDDLWRHTAPYRGLVAMTEADSDFFFGRARKTVEIIRAFEETPAQLVILLGNSGVGKSSLAQAGVLASLARQAWPEEANEPRPWPSVFNGSRRWCTLKVRPGTEPLKALVRAFLETWQFEAADPDRIKHQAGWIELLRDGRATIHDLLEATEKRYEEQQRPKLSGFLLYIDQGEELYVRAEDRERQRFSDIIALGLKSHRLRAFMSMRSDFLGALQNDEALFSVHRKIDVPPLREAELRTVISRPAETLAAKFENSHLAEDIARCAAADSTKDSGALPLLSYLLDDMWQQMIERGDGVLRLPGRAIDIGRVLVERADAFLARDTKSEDSLRKIFTLKLATVREDGEPTRRRAIRSEFTDQEWRLVSELADHPYRLLVTAVPEESEAPPTAPGVRTEMIPGHDMAYVEVAHEAIFRCWSKLREWIAAEREFLAWRSGLEASRRTWRNAQESSKNDALLMGLGLAQARSWFEKRAEDIPKPDREFINLSVERERLAKARLRRNQTLVAALFLGVIALAGALTYGGYLSPTYLDMRARTISDLLRPRILSAEREHTLKPQEPFQECSVCLRMVVVPAGEGLMGSSEGDEHPLHRVRIEHAFAVSEHEVTFDDWEACVAFGGCPEASDSGRGRGTRPVINVSWLDAQSYVGWLSRHTGKRYRLLSEAEWEYAARAGSDKAFPWGDALGIGNANCDGCGSRWDNETTAPVEQFPANNFGLFDMIGNVWEWVEDCYRDNYEGVPVDGRPMVTGDCSRRVVRGGSWGASPPYVRSASRYPHTSDYRSSSLGLRVARTLGP
jgi:formylglycine-generating enzyme required for sulfatase activity